MVYTADDFACELCSVIREHHVYKSVWSPSIGEIFPTVIEAGNAHDAYAVAIIKDTTMVGHAPREVSRMFYFFLQHGGSITAKVTGHRKFGHGLEVPCCYTLTGKPKYIKQAKKLLKVAKQ